jgi:uncharacterized membrane protein YeaQ/YmgE (transglycosylase-associated protein family)
MLHVLWSLVVGFVVGLVARMLVPGADQMGLFATSLLGIGGSLVGGAIARLVNRPEPGAPFHAAGILGSVVGAMLLLFLARMMH